ncbi:hypothetical protein [Microbulbifer echini]
MGGSLSVMNLYPTIASSSSSFELSVMAVRYRNLSDWKPIGRLPCLLTRGFWVQAFTLSKVLILAFGYYAVG